MQRTTEASKHWALTAARSLWWALTPARSLRRYLNSDGVAAPLPRSIPDP